MRDITTAILRSMASSAFLAIPGKVEQIDGPRKGSGNGLLPVEQMHSQFRAATSYVREAKHGNTGARVKSSLPKS